MQPKRRAELQLRHVVAVLRNESRAANETAELADRAEEVVERTAAQIGPDGGQDLWRLLDEARREIADLRTRLTGA